MERLLTSQAGERLELDGHPLQDGDALEVRIIGSWVPGIALHDLSGWSLLTRDQIPIRLQAGLVVRFAPHSPSSSLAL